MEPYFKTKPYDHQLECFNISKDKDVYAILLEQGLGKTKVVLDTVAYLIMNDEIKNGTPLINGLFIVAPNGVHSNWIRREIPAHLVEATNYKCLEFGSSKASTKKYQEKWKELLEHPGLAIFAMNIEALSSSKKAMNSALEFLTKRRCFMVIDESSRIKNPSSNRTKSAIKLGKKAFYRRVLTGTPVTQSPFDVFAQFMFLDSSLLGYSSFYAFKHDFGIFEKQTIKQGSGLRQYEELVKYKRLGHLQSLILPHSYRRTKKECLDIPDKIYQVANIQMSLEQRRLYNSMNEEGILEFEDFSVLAPSHIVKLIRLQQITGGFVPKDEGEGSPVGIPIEGPNPKLNYLMDAVENDYHGKTIIWAKFIFEIQIIVQALKQKFGSNAIVELHGRVKGENRDNSIDRFQDDLDCKFLVGQQQSGIGITLSSAQYVFYFSNPFSYEQRYQTEDRAHRIGTKHAVVYIDLVLENSVDERIREVLHRSRKIADKITGDSERLNEKVYNQSTL